MSPQSPPVTYTLQIISANDLPARRVKRLGERNVIAKATVEGRSVQTKVCMCSSSAEWKETFQIEARKTSSVISLQLSGSTHGTSLNCGSEIVISDLLRRCLYEQEAELDLRGIKSGLQGRIKIRLSLSSNGSLIVAEAQQLALVLVQQPNTAMAAAGGYIDDIDGLLAISVPTPPAMAAQSIVNVLDRLDHFMRIADQAAKVHPYAKLAWDVLSAAHKIIVAQVAIDQSVADLANTMQDVYSFVDAIVAVPSKIQLLEDIIERIFTQTVECAIFIREYSGHGFAGRLLRETMGASTPAKVAGMAQSLITLRGQFDTGVAVQIATISFRIQTDVTTLVKNQTLGLLGSSGVALSSRSRCLPGTCRDVIDEILEWALHPSKGDNSNVFCLHGVSGIGKSAVAATVATHFADMGRLGAFVGFDRASSEQSQPSTVVKALARQMAANDGRLRASIIQVINDDSKDTVLEAPLSEQFDRLIVKTLASVPSLAGEGPIVIVLDALYECGQPSDWAGFLEVLVGQTKSLPPNLRFILTSRTVDGIHKASSGTVLHPRIRSRELRSSSHSDISAYFRFRMQQIRLKNEDVQKDWPSTAAIAELTARAFGYFAWAVNASNFMDAYCPPDRLKSLLLQPLRSISEPNPPLDKLYRAALDSAGDWTDAHFVSDFRAIMAIIIDSPIAISTTLVNHLLDRPLSRPAMVTMRRLGSVLTHEHEPAVLVLHSSFLDFLSSHERCGRDIWYFEHASVRFGGRPATLCLQRMNAALERNICNMTLSVRTAAVLPQNLAYACQSWVDHICINETYEAWEMEKLAVFLRTHILHWFEAMSILNRSEEIAPMLQRVATWFEAIAFEENTVEDKRLGNLVIEAINLARKFAAEIAEHPLYVYYIALPLCPSNYTLYQLLHDALIDPSVPLVPLHGPGRIIAEPATLCLLIMNSGLKRIICNMSLSAHITPEALPEMLAHACQSWVDHICTDGTSGSWEMEKLAIFLRTNLLRWFEAMSILKKSEEIAPMLQRIATWLEGNIFEDHSLVKIVIGAFHFARELAADIVERAEITTLCLQTMNSGLKRNICNMALSARLTTEVLSEVLAYACQSWVDHICTDGTFGSWEMEKLVAFLRTHLLHWFEAMTLLKKSEEIAPMLQRVATWLEENTFEDKSLKDLVIEAINFARKFATEIAEHPLYVYYTALPLLPSHSMLYQLFHDSLADPSVLLVTNPGTMFCLALSTNGRRIVTGYLHHAIVWDTATGEELVEMADTDGAVPLSVAFSYDGSRIACGTDKSTVYVWDSVTGARVIGPLSHSGSSEEVNVVAWSTDGECLLSGCHTGKVILWNITSPNDNQPITKIHHPGCISWADRLSSLVFSSDGSQISSCSRRGDVHVWGSKTGGIVWSVQDPQGSDPSGGVSFLSSDTREFLVVKMKERTQVRDTSTGDLCPLPDSLAGAVGLTRDDCIVNLLMKGIKKQYPQDGKNYVCPEWVVQGEYFAFAGYELCHVVHVPKSLL
ncbi:hypothetical protein FIBSPDRAFT_948829 [Athelia psychrophila]|uniref:C2 domain-containing protein n=1 Tax=Athelia psychrophila TaxID=1759441 RepID=A0A166QIU7_9AGAM|nr:hypothetical protein FIBSPDRAFT_948829 [Fibularhizoctonia sp. CBS 109695]